MKKYTILIILSLFLFACSETYEVTPEERAALLVDYYLLHQDQHFKMVSNKGDTIIIFARDVEEYTHKEVTLFSKNHYQYFNVLFYSVENEVIGRIYINYDDHMNMHGFYFYFLGIEEENICSYYEIIELNGRKFNNVYRLTSNVTNCKETAFCIYTSENLGIIRAETFEWISPTEIDTIIYNYCFD